MLSRSFFGIAIVIAIPAIFAGHTAVRVQTTGSRPSFEAFEVASIKPTGPDPKGRFIRMQSANRFEARNHAFRTLIAAAYDLSPHAISGAPSWVDTGRWNILAKTPGQMRQSGRADVHAAAIIK
jgi:hypothetical protein